MLFKSFAATFLDFAAGKIKQSQLEYGSFDFNCSREKVVSTSDVVPQEASWAHTTSQRKDGYPFITGSQATIEKNKLHPEVIKTWDRFVSIVETAEKQGRVDWKKK